MKYLTPTLKEAIKAVIIDMGGDFNQLDMNEVEAKAVDKIKESGNTKNHESEILSQYISSEEDPVSIYEELKGALHSGGGEYMADDYVTMWEKYEYEFTVAGLLNMIQEG